MTDDTYRELAAAYVLGSLAPDERLAFEDHLEECPRCRDEVLEFSPLPALLARVGPDELSEVPFDPGPALLAASTEEHRRLRASTWRWRLAAAVAALAAVALGLVAAAERWGDDTELAFDPGEAIELTIDSDYVIAGTMTVNERQWGTRIEIDLTGVPRRDGYHLWAVSAEGTWEIAGTWGPTPTGTCRVVGATSIRRAELERVVVTSLDKSDELASAS